MGDGGPSNTLHVSNLPVGTKAEVVKHIFGPSVVECSVLPPDASGRTVAMVLFQSVEDAATLKEGLDGQVPPELAQGMQQPLSIRFSPQLIVPGQGGGGGGYGAAPPAFTPRLGPYGAAPAGGEGRMSSDNLYIKGLPNPMSYESLVDMFSKYGSVTRCKVIEARSATQSTHALVQFSTAEEAAAVKDTLDGAMLPGAIENLSVGFVVSKGKGFGGKGAPWEAGAQGGWGASGSWDGGGKGWGKPAKGMIEMRSVVKYIISTGTLPGGEASRMDGTEIYISGLPYDCKDVDIYRMFSPFGAVAPYGLSLKQHPDGSCRGFAFLCYCEQASANAAVTALNGARLPEGGYLKVVHKIPNYRNSKGFGKDKDYGGGYGAPAMNHALSAEGFGAEAFQAALYDTGGTPGFI